MDFLISDAWAQEGPALGGVGFVEFIPLILLFVVFYFLLIRPQMKRAKEHKQMVAALNKGDEVVTNGGLLGCINDVGDHFVVLEVAKGIEVKIQRQSVAATVPKGTIKTL
ncbi:MAG: preprotein translocase subunit YajC [Gammaproteobacteria bacterium]|jgi:preprotein translocase subunit YajC